jgi:hypothetical protein
MTTTTETAETPSTELDRLVSAAVEKVESGTLTMAALLKALSPNPVEPAAPAKPPMAAVITDEERKALARVVEVFGKVVPTERRALQPTEVDALVEEKQVLDQIKKMAEKRLADGVRPAVFNHFDTEAEAAEGFDPEDTLRDKDGYYVLDGEATGTGSTGMRFTRETREGAPTLDATALKALAEDPEFEGFDHKDYLSMTTQVRVLDESKVMLALKKNPRLVMAVAQATKPGSKTNSFNLRKV